MAASLMDKRTPITTPPYQVPSADVTPDPPIFSLVTTFKGLSKERGQATFLENLRTSLLNKGLSNETTFNLIHLAGQYL
jgi:hypothetical protein